MSRPASNIIVSKYNLRQLTTPTGPMGGQLTHLCTDIRKVSSQYSGISSFKQELEVWTARLLWNLIART